MTLLTQIFKFSLRDSDQPEHPEEPRSASENNSQPSEPESEPAPTEQNGKEEEGETEVEAPPAEVSEDSEAGKEAPACTVGDLIDEEEEESPKEDEKPEEETKEDPDPAADKEEMTEESEKVETANEKEEEEITESVLDKENKKEEARSVKQDTKTAAELAYEWDDDGIEDEKPSPAKTPKKKSESKPKGPPVVDVTPGRKSSRTPKPTQRKLESESQKNLKETEEEEEEEDGDEEDEESVDAIAKELEKSDSDKSPGSGGKKMSAKKGKKPVSEEKSKEEWVNLIFGENGEKVTEKGVKGGKSGEAKETKADGEEPDSEEFLPEDTPKTKKGGRPKKKGLDETLDGVAKLGSNMYFYTGPGGSDSPPPLDSDEEDLPIKKADSEPARKSSRANKGEDLVVTITAGSVTCIPRAQYEARERRRGGGHSSSQGIQEQLHGFIVSISPEFY